MLRIGPETQYYKVLITSAITPRAPPTLLTIPLKCAQVVLLRKY